MIPKGYNPVNYMQPLKKIKPDESEEKKKQ